MIYTRALSNKVLRVPETCYLIVILPHEIRNMSPEPQAGSVDTFPGTVTVTLQRSETTVLIKDVPADVCRNCGEYYLGVPVARKVYAQAEDAVNRHAEGEILRYAA
jgi:YgiT-type zinc finger domain-containing protein